MIQFSVEIIKDSCVLILNMALIYKLKNHSIFFPVDISDSTECTKDSGGTVKLLIV
jgi:hypothetical protein